MIGTPEVTRSSYFVRAASPNRKSQPPRQMWERRFLPPLFTWRFHVLDPIDIQTIPTSRLFMVSPLSSFGPNPSLFPNTIRLLRKGFTGLPWDAGSLRSPSRERTLCWISINTATTLQSQRLYCKSVLIDSSMGADAHHGPSPKGLLCNAGAGAAAGMLSIFFFFFFSRN